MRVLYRDPLADRRGDRDGPGRDMPQTPKLTPAQNRRARDLAMARMEAAGYTHQQIADHYRLTREQVCRRLKLARGARRAVAC